MSEAKLLLVHGGWAGAWIWEPLLEPLRRRGIDTDAIERLPSVGDDPAALGDLDDDADHLRARIDRIGTPVVLCGQSYGGMVITEVADHPGVVHSVYLAALWPQHGQSVLDLLGGEVPDWIVPRDDGTLTLTRDVERARQVLCRDLAPERWSEFHARMKLQSEASARTPSTAPPRSHPSTYVICNRDEAVPVEAQEAWAAIADQTVRLDTAHLAQLPAAEELAAVLARTITGLPASQPVA
jgi:pimeloyl-ACP methyl ester carboxylesterase